MSIRQRVLVGGVATLGVVGASVGWFLAEAPQHRASEIQLEDTAGIISEPDLAAGVADVRFHEPTTVAVFTHRGGEEALTDDLALNDAVLEHARENRTDWLSEDEQRWADGLYIWAVDPEGRLVGTYFGDDRAVGDDAQLAIQDATKEDLGSGRWTDGAVVGVEEAAGRMNAPFIRTAGGAAVAGVASLATLAGAGTWLGVGVHRARKSRRSRAAGDTAMANVVRDQEVTELHARLIPEDSRYGGLMLRRYDDYSRGVRELTELGNSARGIPEKHYDTPEAVERLAAYEERATSLDQLDDVIADTAAFLNRDRAWVDAWHRQVAPVRTDLEGVEDLLGTELPEEVRGLPEADRLRTFASDELAGLDRLRGELEHRRVSPDDALDHLRATRDALSERLDDLAGAVARTFGEDEDERKTLDEAWRTERGRRRPEPTILATAYPTWSWFGTHSFLSGWSAGKGEVEQSRSAATGGASSGYSGGSFSGAGSSSRF
ncbi:DUF5129 domain-containing protein [Ornithinimicrobium sp. W1679]|uniref:DUF5129 domain-containing protein n=1 Tax=unclassified Ornithinimicrobium TaxID=2615080 RepID=UPI003CE9B557